MFVILEVDTYFKQTYKFPSRATLLTYERTSLKAILN